jgi:hypothetical protein
VLQKQQHEEAVCAVLDCVVWWVCGSHQARTNHELSDTDPASTSVFEFLAECQAAASSSSSSSSSLQDKRQRSPPQNQLNQNLKQQKRSIVQVAAQSAVRRLVANYRLNVFDFAAAFPPSSLNLLLKENESAGGDDNLLAGRSSISEESGCHGHGGGGLSGGGHGGSGQVSSVSSSSSSSSVRGTVTAVSSGPSALDQVIVQTTALTWNTEDGQQDEWSASGLHVAVHRGACGTSTWVRDDGKKPEMAEKLRER